MKSPRSTSRKKVAAFRDPKAPTLAEVNAAWAAARRPDAPTGATVIRTDPLRVRPFYQGIVTQHLRQEHERAAGSKLYRPLTTADRRAIRLTRLWLEFGDWP